MALARSLAKRPKLLLLDEPMGALDKKLRDRMQLEVTDILERVGVTCVMVTHDQEEAMTMAGRIAIMNRGKFVQIGEPEEIYEHPNSRFSAEFIGSVNVFDCVLQERHDDALILQSQGCAMRSKSIRTPRWWTACRSGGAATGKDPAVRTGAGRRLQLRGGRSGAYFLPGDLSIYHVKLHSGQIISAQLQNGHRFRKGMPTWGDEVRLCWETDSCVVLTV